MSKLKCLQLFAAILVAGCVSLQERAIVEVGYRDVFDPPRTWLDLSAEGIYPDLLSQTLVRRALEDGREMGLDLVFVKAIRDGLTGKIFLVFEVRSYDDLFYVYVSSSDQSRLLSKFRFSDV